MASESRAHVLSRLFPVSFLAPPPDPLTRYFHKWKSGQEQACVGKACCQEGFVCARDARMQSHPTLTSEQGNGVDKAAEASLAAASWADLEPTSPTFTFSNGGLEERLQGRPRNKPLL